MVKRVLLFVLAAILLLAGVLAANTWRQGSRQLSVPPAAPLALDAAAVADKLAGTLRFRTISSLDDPAANADEFRKLHAYLAQRFPLVHAKLKREIVGGLSLLYTWPGSDATAKGVLFMAHHDVVPIAPGSEAQWKEEPFAGVVKDGQVWGRGAWDNKGNLVAQLEALEMLLAAGFQPRQTVYLFSGADEEVGGLRGAQEAVKLLQERKVRLDFVIDEGLVLTEGVIPGVAAPVAMIGVAEKGFISVRMKVKGAPGHSSMPPAPGSSAIAMMGAALQRLDQNQFPGALQGVAGELFETLAPAMQGFQRVALSNLWLFRPMVERQLARAGSTNAMLRTTTALTIFHAGNKDNVIPGEAEAVVNFRILPGDTTAGVMDHVRKVAGEGFELAALPGASEPTPVTSTRSHSYQQVARTLRAQFPGVVVAPGLYIAGSDSQHFVPIADHIYRFSPVRVKPDDISRLHGTNERIPVANLAELVAFYHGLLRNLNSPAP